MMPGEELRGAWASSTTVPVLLLIEDNAQQRTLLREFMDDVLLCELREAADGDTGMALARDGRPDLVLLDLHIPPRGGIAVLHALRADAHLAHVPVIVLSGSRHSDDLAAVEADAGSRFIEKPYDLDDLEDAIRSMLRTVRTG